MPCTKMVKTHPAVGDTNRNPPDHQCKYVEWKDGFCKYHHPENVAKKQHEEKEQQEQWDNERKAEREAKLKAIENSNSLTVENAIVLLVQNGYRVEKITPPNVIYTTSVVQ